MDKQEIFDGVRDLVFQTIPCNIEVASIITAQIMLETGYLSSDICNSANNLFGMRQPKKRLTYSLGPYKNHSSFSTRTFSIHDYFLWLLANGFVQSDMYNSVLFTAKLRKSPFNPSEKYVDTILKIYKIYVQ